MGLILFVAELGGGFGHVLRLMPVARAAAAAEHRPVFVVSNPEETRGFVGAAGFEVREAPRIPRAPGRAAGAGGPVRTFADLLGAIGFAESRTLASVTAAWDVLLADLQPAAIVCEHSPFLCLATFGGNVPVLVLGYGFILPPPHLPQFPPLWSGPASYDEDRLLELCRRSCAARSRPEPSSLPLLFAGAAHAVTGLDALDPYRDLRDRAAVGPPALAIARAEGPPESDFFAYLLGDASPTLAILDALRSSGLSGQVFVRRGVDAQRRLLHGSRVAWLEQPASPADTLPKVRFIVHHGSMLTSEESLAAGKPQLVVPLYFEHLLTARSLRELGIATVVAASGGQDAISQALSETMAKDTLTPRARAVSDDYWKRSSPSPDLPTKLLRLVTHVS